jgi:hypothetical protein
MEGNNWLVKLYFELSPSLLIYRLYFAPYQAHTCNHQANGCTIDHVPADHTCVIEPQFDIAPAKELIVRNSYLWIKIISIKLVVMVRNTAISQVLGDDKYRNKGKKDFCPFLDLRFVVVLDDQRCALEVLR